MDEVKNVTESTCVLSGYPGGARKMCSIWIPRRCPSATDRKDLNCKKAMSARRE